MYTFNHDIVPDVSSNINEVITAVLNSFFFFLRKDFARTKSTNITKWHKDTQGKTQNVNKRITGFFFLDVL